MLKKARVIAKKELTIYFNTPIAYITVVLFLIINGWFFGQSLFLNNIATLHSFLNICPFILMFFIPAIIMRLISDEKRTGFIEIMLTLPIKDADYVLGKFIAGSALATLAILFTFIYPVSTAFIGKLDWGMVLGAYTGLILLSWLFVAISLFASSISANQVIAFFLSFVLIFVLFILGKIVQIMPPFIVSVIEYISTDYHLLNISKGVIDSRDIIYYFSGIFIFLFFTYQTLDMRKYK